MQKIKLLLTTLVIISLIIFIYIISYKSIEPKAYDFMIRNIFTEKLPFDNIKQNFGSDDIVIVVIDEKSNLKYRWPWKRELHCKFYNYFKEYAMPKVIVHDALITTLDKDNPNSDKNYFKTISPIKNLVVGFLPKIQLWEDFENGEKYDEFFAKKYAIKNVENKTNTFLYSSLMKSPKEYLDVIHHIGSVSLISGFIDGDITSVFNDEIYRNYEYVIHYKDNIYPSLAMSVFNIINDNPKLIVTKKQLKFPDLKYNINQKTTSYENLIPIRFYKFYDTGYSHNVYSAIDIMDSYDSLKKGQRPLIDPKTFEDKIIVYGANVPAGDGLNDNKQTPMSAMHPGVDIQATTIDNLIHNDFLTIVPKWLNILITLFGMLIVYLSIRFYDLHKSILYSLLIITGYLVLSTISFYFGIVINVVTPIVMFAITMILGYTHKFILENRSKEKVKKAMGKYVSNDVMQRVVSNIDNLGLGGKKSIVTVLFSDIRGFTSISEKMSAQEVSEFLNEYFTAMEPIVTKYNGIINKFIGDAVMAIFGEPILDKDHAINAVKCGYEMLLKVDELQKKWTNEGKPKIEIGVGISTGDVFVGNMGSVNRMEYTVIGDTVNLASRLESYNKIYKSHMLISSKTYEQAKGIIETIKISDVEIRGKAEKMDIYEVLKVNLNH